METYQHHVTGFFVKREEAQISLAKLVLRGIPNAQLKIYENDTSATAPPPNANSSAVLKDVLVDGAVGTAVGAGVGLLAELALVAANVSLFVASPLLAPLVMLGWGASLGGVVGAVAGAENKEKKTGWFADLIGEAILAGQVVLVAETHTEEETAIAREVIQEAVGAFKDIRTV